MTRPLGSVILSFLRSRYASFRWAKDVGDFSSVPTFQVASG